MVAIFDANPGGLVLTCTVCHEIMGWLPLPCTTFEVMDAINEHDCPGEPNQTEGLK